MSASGVLLAALVLSVMLVIALMLSLLTVLMVALVLGLLSLLVVGAVTAMMLLGGLNSLNGLSSFGILIIFLYRLLSHHQTGSEAESSDSNKFLHDVFF